MTIPASKPLGKLVSNIGLLLVILYGIVIAFDVLPIKLLDPDWFVLLATTLNNFVTIPMVGIVLILLGAHLSPSPPDGMKLQKRIARLAALLALIFLVFQPIIASVAINYSFNLNAYTRRQQITITERATGLKEAIIAATTFNDLQQRLAKLQGPQIGVEASSVPLPQLKEQLLNELQKQRVSYPEQLKSTLSANRIEAFKALIKLSIMSAISCIGFALLSWDPIRQKNLVFTYLGSIGIGGLTPVSIAKRLVQVTSGLRQGFQKTIRENVRLSRDKQLAQERQRLQQKQKQEAKRREQERRKQLERFNRSRSGR